MMIKHHVEVTADESAASLSVQDALGFLSELPQEAVATGSLVPIMRDRGGQRDSIWVLHGLRVEWTSDR